MIIFFLAQQKAKLFRFHLFFISLSEVAQWQKKINVSLLCVLSSFQTERKLGDDLSFRPHSSHRCVYVDDENWIIGPEEKLLNGWNINFRFDTEQPLLAILILMLIYDRKHSIELSVRHLDLLPNRFTFSHPFRHDTHSKSNTALPYSTSFRRCFAKRSAD